ncbi:hypothetical protein SRABI27_04392 [Pedobacter sp. Bi27]|nr:hypothetical protein SRABI36_04626 [Pedobacter sp. Bi36]CAH0301003.1 hypothetical protein SRABI27_04392 [Pedobacter sp. Bi27]CAH0310629.1 hypothetical protein SRABI126_04747 [Pedobacter sp. Bi126]
MAACKQNRLREIESRVGLVIYPSNESIGWCLTDRNDITEFFVG